MAASMCTLPFAAVRALHSKQLYLRIQQVALLRSLHLSRCQTAVTTQISGAHSKRHLNDNRSFSSGAPQVNEDVASQASEVGQLTEAGLVVQEKPEGYMAWKPVDDVYMRCHYPPQKKSFNEAMEILRQQDKWMFCRKANKYADRTVTISVNLDMALQKKKRVDPFQNMLILPHPFKDDNRVLCFARGSDQQAAIDAGADIIGDEEIVPKVQSKEVKDFDFCVSTPDMMPALTSLKRLLRKRFPNSKRGSAGQDLTTIIHRYKKGQEYKCQAKANHVNVSVGKLSLTNEQIEENMQVILTDICKHKPVQFGPFITKLTVNAFLLDGVQVDFEKYLPKLDSEAESSSAAQEKVTL